MGVDFVEEGSNDSTDEKPDRPTDQQLEDKRQAELAHERSEHMRMRAGGNVDGSPRD